MAALQRGQKSRHTAVVRSLIAVAVIVGALAAAWYFLFGEDDFGGRANPNRSTRIKEVRPASASQKADRPTADHPTSKSQQKPGTVNRPNDEAAVENETVASTNNASGAEAEKKEKDTRPFKNIMNQLLAMVMPKNPGEMIPPLPLAEEMRFTDEQEREMLKQLTVEEHDTAETIKRKELVQSLQDEYFELKKRGWTFVDYLKALQAKVNLDAEVMQESFKIYKGIFDDPNISDEKYKETLDSINKVLTDRGLKPIEPTASGLPEDEEGNIIYETEDQTTTEEKQ